MSKKKRLPKFVQAIIAKRQPPGFSTTPSVLAPGQVNLRAEVDHVCQLASQCECRVIGLNELVFFSTVTGDAWMLDWKDEYAICLMKDGALQACEFGETARNFVIPWQGRYRIEGGLFAYIDQKNPTHGRIIGGYPTDAIRQTISSAGSATDAANSVSCHASSPSTMRIRPLR